MPTHEISDTLAYVGYFPRFSVDYAKGTLTCHHVEGSNRPDTGADELRPKCAKAAKFGVAS